MNLTMFNFRSLPATVTIAALITLAISGALLAKAAETPVVSAQIRTAGNTQITAAAIGTSVHAYATVASATSSDPIPSGTVDFNYYPNGSCSGTAITESGIALSAGAANGSATNTPPTGLSYKVHYNGQADVYPVADSSCVALTATSGSVSIATTLSTTTVLVGTSVYETASLSGATSDADGTVQYRSFSNSSCTTDARDAGTKNVNDGTVPNSDSLTFNSAGTFYWNAVYSGDADNVAATSTCRALSVVNSFPTTGTGSIHGTVYNDANKDGSQNNGEGGLSGWTVWLHKTATSTTSVKKGYDAPIVATVTTDGSGQYSFGTLDAGRYFIEEKNETGWFQSSEDRFVTVVNGSSLDVDFANYQKTGTSTDPNDDTDDQDGHHDGSCSVGDHKDKGDDSGDDSDKNGRAFDPSFWKNLGKHDNGNHFGWFKNGKDEAKSDDNGKGNKGRNGRDD